VEAFVAFIFRTGS